MAFFRGRPGYEHTEGHDNLAKKIGAAGKDWAEHHWRKEDMAAYMCKSMGRELLDVSGWGADHGFGGVRSPARARVVQVRATARSIERWELRC